MDKKTPPTITTIIPVYNVAKYLRASIDSVINQTIGFEDNIELILVNDGSKDKSGEICKGYAARYPDNIIYIEQKNQGVSAARNTGLKKASGKYVNFFDGDDIWSKDAYKKSVAFLEAHYDEVDLVASKIKFFDANIDSHPANYKFGSNRVINLKKDPDNPLFHLMTCVFKRSALSGKSFNTKLKISEDARLLSEVLLDKKAYGVLKGPVYNYRKRGDETSAIGGQAKTKHYYLTVPKLAYLYMMDLWTNGDKKVGPFMQCEILGDLYWRFRLEKQTVLSPAETAIYKKLIVGIVKRLDDKAIINKRNFPLALKVLALRLKYGVAGYEKRITFKDGCYRFNDIKLATVRELSGLTLEFIHDLGDDAYKIEGYINNVQISSKEFYTLETSLGQVKVKRARRAHREHAFLGETIYDGGGFEATIRVAPEDQLTAILVAKNGEKIKVPIHTKPFTNISELDYSYCRRGDKLFRKLPGNIEIRGYSKWWARRYELNYLVRIMTNWRLSTALELLKRTRRKNFRFLPLRAKIFEAAKPFLVVAEAVLMIPRAFLLRSCYHVIKRHIKRPIWLVSDRGMAAGDNGEAFFRYLNDRDDLSAKVYFVLSKKSKDYARVKKYGKVVNQNGLYYKLLFLLSDKIISSQADVETTNPFIRQLNHYDDLFSFDFVFLQHGIIRHDLSKWLNRFSKNIALFVTSAQKEYDSVMHYPYYYSKKNIILSGLPRYDLLSSEPNNKLILAPTYRKDLARNHTDKNGFRHYDKSFKNSDYFEFYNGLINDKKLLSSLKQHGMTGEFYLHPGFAAQISDFESNDIIQVQSYPYDYSKAFREGNLLISDYSSVMFDFAYLKKPVVYSQFDADIIYERHTYEPSEFFDDKKDGFGPVANDYSSLIDETIKNIESGCKMAQKYVGRVDKFYYNHDHNNSERVYKSIIAYDAAK